MYYLDRGLNETWSDWFDRFFDDSFFPASRLAAGKGKGLQFLPKVDIAETDKQVLLSFDLPGVDKEQVKVELNGNTLKVSGERKHEWSSESEGEKKGKGVVKRVERSFGRFERSFTLPEHIDPERAEAHFENGVLRLNLEKRSQPESREIKVKTR